MMAIAMMLLYTVHIPIIYIIDINSRSALGQTCYLYRYFQAIIG